MKNKLNIIGSILLFIALFALLTLVTYSVSGQTTESSNSQSAVENIQLSGGQFTLEKSVVAGGGSRMLQSQTSAAATAGQSIAGYKSSGGQFKLYSGFWTPDDFAPTAAVVLVGGRVSTADGRGIKNVVITIIFPSGERRITRSSSFGYYSFTDIPVGATYIISVAAKRYTFSQAVLIRSIEDDTQDINFIADA